VEEEEKLRSIFSLVRSRSHRRSIAPLIGPQFGASPDTAKALGPCTSPAKTPENYLETSKKLETTKYPFKYQSTQRPLFSRCQTFFWIICSSPSNRNWTSTPRQQPPSNYSTSSHTRNRKDASHVHCRWLWQARLHSEEGCRQRSHQVRTPCTVLTR